jgi:hypothetical protein
MTMLVPCDAARAETVLELPMRISSVVTRASFLARTQHAATAKMLELPTSKPLVNLASVLARNAAWPLR